MQETGAVHALDSLDRNIGTAPGTSSRGTRGRDGLGLGGLRSGIAVAVVLQTVTLTHLADLLGGVDNDKESNGNQNKVDKGHDESTHVFGHGTILLGTFNGVIVLIGSPSFTDDNKVVLQVGSGNDKTQRRGQDIIDKTREDLGECTSNDQTLLERKRERYHPTEL